MSLNLGLIKRLALALVFLGFSGFVWAEPDTTETQEVEEAQIGLDYKTVVGEAESAAQTERGEAKRRAYIDLACLYELSLDYGTAAAAWREAAFAASGERDDSALLRSARCLILCGDFDRADADLRTVLQTGRSDSIKTEASRLSLLVATVRGKQFNTDDVVNTDERVLTSSENDKTIESGPDLEPVLLYLRYRLDGSETALKRLMAQYPNSPEARALSPSSGTTEALTPLLLLHPGRSAFVEATRSVLGGEAKVVSSFITSTYSEIPDSNSEIKLQVGLFRLLSNASELVDRLQKQGFRADTEKRSIDGEAYSAVVVYAGKSSDETLFALKELGLEAFPLFE